MTSMRVEVGMSTIVNEGTYVLANDSGGCHHLELLGN